MSCRAHMISCPILLRSYRHRMLYCNFELANFVTAVRQCQLQNITSMINIYLSTKLEYESELRFRRTRSRGNVFANRALVIESCVDHFRWWEESETDEGQDFELALASSMVRHHQTQPKQQHLPPTSVAKEARKRDRY